MSFYMRGVRRLSCMTSVWWFWRFDVFCWRLDVIFTSVSAKRFDFSVYERSRTELFLIEKCSYFSVKFIKQHIFKSKCNCRRKSMQEKQSVTRVTPLVRRYFLAPVGFTEIPVGYARMSFPECMLPVRQMFMFIQMSFDIRTYYLFK